MCLTRNPKQYSFFDAMARRALWDVGLNYGHGTGHGIGAYLNVHEYPPLISSRNMAPGMLKNMFTSNGNTLIHIQFVIDMGTFR